MSEKQGEKALASPTGESQSVEQKLEGKEEVGERMPDLTVVNNLTSIDIASKVPNIKTVIQEFNDKLKLYQKKEDADK